jgi:hypothetical protein
MSQPPVTSGFKTASVSSKHNAQSPSLLERIASLMPQWHLACLLNSLCGANVPITALVRFKLFPNKHSTMPCF